MSLLILKETVAISFVNVGWSCVTCTTFKIQLRVSSLSTQTQSLTLVLALSLPLVLALTLRAEGVFRHV